MLISLKKINDTTHVCSTIFSTHTWQSFLWTTVNSEAVLAVRSLETRYFSQDSSCFLRDGGNLHLSGTVTQISGNSFGKKSIYITGGAWERICWHFPHRNSSNELRILLEDANILISKSECKVLPDPPPLLANGQKENGIQCGQGRQTEAHGWLTAPFLVQYL